MKGGFKMELKKKLKMLKMTFNDLAISLDNALIATDDAQEELEKLIEIIELEIPELKRRLAE